MQQKDDILDILNEDLVNEEVLNDSITEVITDIPIKEVLESSISDMHDDKEITSASEIQNANKSLKNKYKNNPNVPQLVGIDYPQEFIEIAEYLQKTYNELPVLDYEELYYELATELTIKSSPTPTLQVFNNELQKVQAAKDRLAEIYVTVIRNHTFKKRAVDILRDSWGKFSNAKNAEQRKGDSMFRMSYFENDLALTDGLSKTCFHVLKNLDSLSDNLSRRITTIQLQLKMHDFGRHGLPDADYVEASTIDSILNSQQNREPVDENEEISPEMGSF